MIKIEFAHCVGAKLALLSSFQCIAKAQPDCEADVETQLRTWIRNLSAVDVARTGDDESDGARSSSTTARPSTVGWVLVTKY